MASATEGMHAGEFIIRDQSEDSRDNVVVLSGQTLVAGELVGKVTISGIGSVSVPSVSGTGNGTASLVTAGPLCQVGSYVATCTAAATHGGTFNVVAPDGGSIGTLTLTGGSGATTAFKSAHINFSLTDGGTDFIVGDSFTFVVGTTAPTVIGGTGTGTISALSLGSKTQRGTYKVVFTTLESHGGRFQVISPSGNVVVAAAMNTTTGGALAFTSDHINFTLTDANDFIVGNYFNVAVYGPAAAPKAVQWDPYPSTWDGRQHVAGIAFDNYDASAADVKGVIETRWATVKGELLTFKSGVNAADKAWAKTVLLPALGVVVR